MKAADTPGWFCGPRFYSADVLREFAQTQVLDTLNNRSSFLFPFWENNLRIECRMYIGDYLLSIITYVDLSDELHPRQKS